MYIAIKSILTSCILNNLVYFSPCFELVRWFSLHNCRSALDRNDVPLKKQGLINSPLTSDSNQKVPLKLAVNFKRKVIKLGSSTISTEVQPVTTSTTHSNSTATQKVQTTAEPPEKKARAKITWPWYFTCILQQ